MSNPYSNFNNPEGLHFPRIASEEQAYGVAAAAALKSLGTQNLDTFLNTAQTWASSSDVDAKYSDVGFVPSVAQFAATSADAGAYSTAPSGATIIRRFGAASAQYWTGGTALPYHFARLVGFYRRNQATAEYGSTLGGLASNLPSLQSPDLAATYAVLSTDFNGFLNDPVANANVVLASSLMAAIQIDEPNVLPAPEYDGDNGLTSQASNPGTNEWRAPGYIFTHVIDVTGATTSTEGNPFVLAAEEFNARSSAGADDFINVPAVSSASAAPTIAVLLPERTLTSRVTLNTPLGTTTSGQVATFNLDGKQANIHFIGPWASSSSELAQARLDARDDTNITYKAVISAGSNGAAESDQLCLGFGNVDAFLDVQLWCVSVESAASRALRIGPDNVVSNETALGTFRAKLNMCRVADKKPISTIPPTLYGLEVTYAHVDMNGVYVDLPYTQSHAIFFNNARKGNMDLLNVQTVRSGGGAFYARRDNTAVDTAPVLGRILLKDWNCPDSWTSRLTSNASYVLTVAGIHNNLEVDNCLINEDAVAAGRATDNWATADHTNASAIGSTFLYTSPLLGVLNSVDGATLGAPGANGQFSEQVIVKNSDLFSEAAFTYLVRLDSADTLSLTDSEIFAGTTTAIAGPNGETAADQNIYFAPNNLGDLPSVPSAGLIRSGILDDINATTPAGSTDPTLYGGGDPALSEAPVVVDLGGGAVSSSDGLGFLNFTGGTWDPTVGNPQVGDFSALSSVFNTVYTNKDLRVPALLASRMDVDTRADLLDANSSVPARRSIVDELRTRGEGPDLVVADFWDAFNNIDYYFSGGPVYIKDGRSEPYYALSNPCVYRTIKTGNRKYYLIFDPNIPESADWDPVAQTGAGPQYMRALGQGFYSGLPGFTSNNEEPGWAVPPGYAQNLPGGGQQGYNRFTVEGLTEGLVNSDYRGEIDTFDGPRNVSNFNGSNSSTAYHPPYIDFEVSVVPDPRNGRDRCEVSLKYQNISQWWTDQSSKVWGHSKSGDFHRRINGVSSLEVGYPKPPGAVKFHNMRAGQDSINGYGEEPDTPHWLMRSSGMDCNVQVLDSDFADIRKEHLMYMNITRDFEVRRSTYRRAGSQSLQMICRAWHYGSVNQEDWDAGPFDPVQSNVPRDTRSSTNVYPPGVTPPLGYQAGNLSIFRPPSWDKDNPFRFQQYPPDNSPVTIRQTAMLDDVHIIDSGRAGARPAFAISFFNMGSFRAPSTVTIQNTSIVSAYTGHTRSNAQTSTNLDFLDSSDPLTYGTPNSTPFYYDDVYRANGCIAMTTTLSTEPQYGKTAEVIREVRSEAIPGADDAAKKQWLTANMTGAPYHISAARIDDIYGKGVDKQWRFENQGTGAAWAGADKNAFENWVAGFKRNYVGASWAEGTEGYQEPVPFSGGNEWGVRDTTTNNMWWYNNDVRFYEEDPSGGYKFVDGWENHGPISGNGRTKVTIDNVLLDVMTPEKRTMMKFTSTDHLVIKDSCFIRRLDDNPSKGAQLGTFRESRISVDRESVYSWDGFSDLRGTRSRRVTLDNITARAHNTQINVSASDWYTSTPFHQALQGTDQELVTASGQRRYDNIFGPIQFALAKIEPRPGYTDSGMGIGGHRSASEGSATSEVQVDFGITLSGLDLRGQLIEFVLVPATSDVAGTAPDAGFLSTWAAAGYPMPEVVSDVVFPDGENHEYLKYPTLFDTYRNDIATYPLRYWSWVAVWNGNHYTEGQALEAALPKVAGWIDPETFNY